MTRRVKPWTDEEIGWLLDNPHLTAREAGEELGRGRQSVQVMRNKLRDGWTPVKEPFTEDELDFVRATPNLTVRQVAVKLNISYHRAGDIRKRLAATEGLRFGGKGSRKNPHEVGRRRLLAKSCPKCGLLLDASWFGFNKNRWRSACMRCVPKQAPRPPRDDKREVDSKNYAKLQSLTLDRATRHGQPWVEADHDVLRDPDLTLLTKALTLGRSYSATASACSRSGYASKVGKGEAAKGVWVIDNPNEAALAA